MRSRDKGARGERDAAKAWAEATGATCRRGQQFSGSPDSPDVVTSQPDIHLEVKRVERGNPYDWVEQAVRDGGPKVPVVLHRRNNKPWLVIVRLEDVMRLANSIAAEAKGVDAKAIPADLPG
jgi:Holliday junction resolvase